MGLKKTGSMITILTLCILLVGCGSGGGNTGLSTSTMILKGEGDLDGHIAHFFGGTNQYTIANASVGIQVGCSYNGFDATRIGFKGFLSFNLSSIPANATITSVTLRVNQSLISGDPYGKLGNLVVEHVSYNTFDGAGGEALYVLAALDGAIPATPLLSTDATLGYKTLDVTAAVQADLTASRSRAQFRIRFENETAVDTSSNYIAWTSGNSATNQPELVIEYH